MYAHVKCSFDLTGQTIREKRIVETANRKELDYEAGDIPTEWEGKCSLLIGCSERQNI